ncbi:putative nucleic acid-binding Zn ribbon protein [Stackebrandtia albiflava]|uniref:Putative nucleic acid-binding Zn ribbon protein n=1 Tax=Stackebrandtia albiflava TaxID=406432 RepID=A0A562V0R7_9ACTN|nr:DciA family protein [Stackebrandtia albiflava]TWJ11506.1 putative nucleic acid-binding Zn ribbon protein [Stackebrandtia albiflava]
MSYESSRRPRRRRRGGWSGPGPDDRDPQLLGDVLGKLVKDRGWRRPAAHAGLFARWPELVGQEVAAHCRPVACQDGELIVEAESSAWATQLRLFKAQMLARLAGEVGPGVVDRIRVQGPSQPSYVSGPRRVRFGGSRDDWR